MFGTPHNPSGAARRVNAPPLLTSTPCLEGVVAATSSRKMRAHSKRLTDHEIRQRLEDNSMPEPNSGCRIWLRQCQSSGHGVIYVGGKPKQTLAHRESYRLNRGPIPAGMCVCHTCDVPSCVNVDHLFLGTHADNMADMVRKGRGRGRVARGSSNGNAKINEEIAAAIREAIGTQKEIAARFGVSPTTVSLIRAGHYWKAA